MPLSAGDKLGRYVILAPIGAGGMGEVKTRDPRLDRVVAIRVSKSEFSERVEREARATAALNHPHIATLHDVGPDFLVMEFVKGETRSEETPLRNDTATDSWILAEHHVFALAPSGDLLRAPLGDRFLRRSTVLASPANDTPVDQITC